MSKSHRNPTINFHIANWEREEIEAKIIASGLSKRDYFVRSCIYNRVCVVGKKELIYKLVQELQTMQMVIKEVAEPQSRPCRHFRQIGLYGAPRQRI